MNDGLGSRDRWKLTLCHDKDMTYLDWTILLFFTFSLLEVNCQQQWQIQKESVAQILTGVSFSTTSVGFVAGDANGTGPALLKTVDGGNSYSACSIQGFPLFFTSIVMSSPTNGVVTGIGEARNFHSIEYTLDGEHWNLTDSDLLEDSQSVELITGVDGAFAMTGYFLEFNETTVNGVSVSYDQGQSWKNIDIHAEGQCRYGAFPSPLVWYVTSSLYPEMEFPSMISNSSDNRYYSFSQNLRFNGPQAEFATYPSRLSSQSSLSYRHGRKLLQTGYLAEISKTVDGGQTWNIVFRDESTYYLNGIDCPTENLCWAVGESQLGSAEPGCRILHTNDGGATWVQQLYVNESGYSLLDIAFVSETEGWAVGGVLDARFQGTYWHTLDSGKTWNFTTLNIPTTVVRG